MPRIKQPMTVYHINDECFSMGSKNQSTGKYPPSTRWMWGHIVTNKATRGPGRYAVMLDPEGAKAHYLTKAMFKRLCQFCEHKYLPVVADKDVDNFCGQVQDLTAAQLRRVAEALDEHPMYEDIRC